MQTSKEISNKITRISSLIDVKAKNKLINHLEYSFALILNNKHTKILKAILTSILFFIFPIISNCQNSIKCLPDKGIKTARTHTKLESGNNKTSSKINGYREIHYDLKGRPILIINSYDGTEHRREYNNEKLQLIITSRKEFPNFYSAEELDSLIANAPILIDTANIINHNLNDEVKNIRNSDGSYLVFDFNACQEELQTYLTSEGDTIHQYKTRFKNGAVIETIWTPFKPIKSNVITKYYDYKFNKHGHWIKRKYKRREGIIIEKRKLIYY